ncbi:MAG: alpha/beta fold hydrolase [Bacteroidota bacterium]
MNLWCLHGNLQQPSVWHPFKNCWSYQGKPLALKCPSLWRNPATDFTSWTNHFTNSVAAIADNQSQWLLGYSLGGRLALHAACSQPSLWTGVVVIGAHPGYQTQSERKKQLAWDTKWAGRFSNEPWEILLEEWNELPVFGGIPNPTKPDLNTFDRRKVAATFTRFSKGQQSYLIPALSALQTPPILYITGEKDTRYHTIGQMLQTHCPTVQHVVIPNACHRVPWENTPAFIKIIQVFLDQTP